MSQTTTEGGIMSVAELEHVSQQIDERQMEIPGLDGYKAEKLAKVGDR